MKLLKILTLISICLFTFLQNIEAAKPKVKKKEVVLPKYSTEQVLKEILKYKNLDYRPDIELPTLILASKASLKTFQDEVEPQWHFRPDSITNVFIVGLNKIYLNDDKSYYIKVGRCIDDSLAHEITHYIQVKYRGWSLDDESLEWDAVDTQTWFRQNFCKLK